MAALDLTSMSVLDEGSLATNMRAMLDSGIIYARSGQLLISLNPFKPLPLYNEETLLAYRTTNNPASLKPHIYGVAAEAHARLIDRGRSQTIIISGESGAGKTENAKFVMQYLASTVIPKETAQAAQSSEGGALGLLSSFFKPLAGGGGSSGGVASLHERLLRSNPLLEAFGCARTEHNANSSRYGKFIELRFGRTGKLIECRLTTYLLEKSRVVSHGERERSYSALYALCAGATRSERSALSLASSGAAEPFVYLQPNVPRAGEDDAATMATMREAFERLGVAAAEQADLYSLLAGVLHLGNAELRASGGEAEAALASDGAKRALRLAAGLLGLDEAQLSDGLLKQRMRAGNEWVTRAHSLTEAEATRDALAKALYAQLFAWLVRRISESLRADGAAARADAIAVRNSVTSPRAGPPGATALPSPRGGGADGGTMGSMGGAGGGGGGELFIGIIDIFGFELFEHNSLEQLCINYANEKLQRLFVECIFVEAQRQYAEQGVKVAHVDFAGAKDGQKTIELLEGRPAGVLPLLAEECILRNGSDGALLAKLQREHGAHPRFAIPMQKGSAAQGAGSTFRVAHYAHAVDYSIVGFLAKNKDPLNQNLAVLLQKSRRPFIGALFKPADDDGATKAPPAAPVASGAAGGARVVRSASFQRTTRRGAAGGGNSRFTGVADQFGRSLEALMRTVEASDIAFVRCFRPNGQQAAGKYDDRLVRSQLASSGLLHAIQLARSAYPDSLDLSEVVGRFAMLVPASAPHPARGARDKKAAQQVLAAIGVPPAQYALGHSKAFFKLGVLAQLNGRRSEHVAKAAHVVQRMGRGLLARRLAKRHRNAAAERAREEAEAAERRRIEQEAERKVADEARIKAEQDSLLRRAQEAAERSARQAQEAGLLPPPVAPSPRPVVLMPTKAAGGATGSSAAAARANGVSTSDVGISFKEVMDGYTLLYATPPKGPAPTGAEAAALDRLKSSGLLLRLGLQNKPDELLSYARYLGMDPQRDWQLLWIADEALGTPAPPGWVQQLDPTGGTFFQNVVTADVSLQHPCDYHFQQLYYRERVELLRQVAAHTLTAEDLAALPELSSWRAEVLYPFNAEEAGEMSVRPKDVLTILGGEVAPDGWYMAAFRNAVGLVPQTYVQESRTRYVDKSGAPAAPVHRSEGDTRGSSLLSPRAGGTGGSMGAGGGTAGAYGTAGSKGATLGGKGGGTGGPADFAQVSPRAAAVAKRPSVSAPPPAKTGASPAEGEALQSPQTTVGDRGSPSPGGRPLVAAASPATEAAAKAKNGKGKGAGEAAAVEEQRKPPPPPKGCCLVS